MKQEYDINKDIVVKDNYTEETSALVMVSIFYLVSKVIVTESFNVVIGQFLSINFIQYNWQKQGNRRHRKT